MIEIDERPEEEELLFNMNKEKTDFYIFLVDRSGSMKGKKMDMTIEALHLFL